MTASNDGESKKVSYELYAAWRKRPYFRGTGPGQYADYFFRGREQEISLLKNIFTSGSGTVLVCGHRGVGKTATVDKALIETARVIPEDLIVVKLDYGSITSGLDKDDKGKSESSQSGSRNETKSSTNNKSANSSANAKERDEIRGQAGELVDPRQVLTQVIYRLYEQVVLTEFLAWQGIPEGWRGNLLGSFERLVTKLMRIFVPERMRSRYPEQLFRKSLTEKLEQAVQRALSSEYQERYDDIRRQETERELSGQLAFPILLIIAFVAFLAMVFAGFQFERPTLFGVGSGISGDIDQERVLSTFVEHFDRPGIDLTEQVTVTTETQNEQWRISDPRIGKTYIVTRINGVLGAYESPQLKLLVPLGQLANALKYLGIGGIAVLTLGTLAFTVTRRRSRVSAAEIAYSLDNSTATLKRDLEGILDLLQSQTAPREFRLIVIIDELDKLDNPYVLDRIIESFKNLFTLWRAVFVFITDINYYEHLERLQAEAYRRRTYSKHHTFFTRKVFLTRPSFDELEMFLQDIGLNVPSRPESDPGIDKRLGETRLPPYENWEVVKRFLMFESRSHYFDLVNAIDRFVQVDAGRTQLELRTDLVSPLELKVRAYFQAMVEMVFEQERYPSQSGERQNNDLLFHLYRVFDTRSHGRFKMRDVLLESNGEDVKSGEVDEHSEDADRKSKDKDGKSSDIDAKAEAADAKANEIDEYEKKKLNGATRLLIDLLRRSSAIIEVTSVAGESDPDLSADDKQREYSWRPAIFCDKPEEHWLRSPQDEMEAQERMLSYESNLQQLELSLWLGRDPEEAINASLAAHEQNLKSLEKTLWLEHDPEDAHKAYLDEYEKNLKLIEDMLKSRKADETIADDGSGEVVTHAIE